jgi:hypothetical protein
MPDWADVRQDAINALGLRRIQRRLIVREGIRLGLVTREEVARARREAKGKR